MFKNLKTIRTFYRLSKVKPFLIFLLFLTLLVPAVLSVWTPVLVSRTITAITVYDFNQAIHQTVLGFGIVIVSAVSYFLYHLVSKKVNKEIILNYQTYVYYNVKNNKQIKKINLTTIKDISSCVDFNKNLIYKFCFFIKSIIILSIILYYSYVLALSIVAVSLISFALLKLTDKKIQYKTMELSKYELASLDLFNSICSGENAEHNYNLECTLKDKYFEYVGENIKTTDSISFLYSINNNFISLILKLAVFFATIFLIGRVRSTELTLSVYLILTPYLTSSAENLISFFDIFTDLSLMENTLKQFESLKYIGSPPSDKPIEISSYNLYFYNVSIYGKNKLEDINIKIGYKDMVCFVGDEDYKIDEIFSILSKKSMVSSGCVFLDGKNISDFDNLSYNKFVAFVTENEQFFNISIYENLYLVCPSRTKIFQAIKTLKLTEFINSFDNKINTIVDSNISQKQRFFLGLVRAYLSDAKIINIFKLPENLTKTDRKIFKQMLMIFKKHCTIICYFNEEQFEDIFDQIYLLENNKIKMNKMSKNADNNSRN